MLGSMLTKEEMDEFMREADVVSYGFVLDKARKKGVPVGWRSGGRLATTLVATEIIFIFKLI